MSDGTHIELTDAEDRVLAMYGWLSTQRMEMLHRAVGLNARQWRDAEDRLLEIGFISPGGGMSTQ